MRLREISFKGTFAAVTEGPINHRYPERSPAHLWVVGLLLVLWNGWGIALAIGAQTERLPVIDAEMSAYFEAQPLWFVLFADLGPLAGVAGAVALLLHSRSALWLFIAQFVILVLGNAYEFVIGTSLLHSVPESRGATVVLAVLLGAQIAYVYMIRRRGLLT